MKRQRFLMFLRFLALPGRGARTPTRKLIDKYVDYRAFLVHNLGVRLPQGCGAVRALRQ